MHIKKDLSAEGLYYRVYEYFKQLDDKRESVRALPSSQMLMSGLALFSLKSPSLLQFDECIRKGECHDNMRLFHVQDVPSDTYMRERLDEIDPSEVRPAFNEVFRMVQRSKYLERFQFLNDAYLLSLDGTGYFSSREIYCEHCCVKSHRDGKKTYYHQMLGGVLVHPDEKIVLPFAPEPILKQDGTKKNDCERNAAKRMLTRIRKEHPRLKLIVTEDALASNAPHIQLLKDLKMQFILGVKPGDHKALFDWVTHHDEVQIRSEQKGIGKAKVRRTYRWLEAVPLNETHPDLLVNFLEVIEETGDKTRRFSWVTDLPLNQETVSHIMKGGRARWKIENETFNTLKNQGYRFEHNFGHGHKHLSTVFATLMFLAFAIDQVQQMACKRFKAALVDCHNRKTRLWERMRNLFLETTIDSWETLFKILSREIKLVPIIDTS